MSSRYKRLIRPITSERIAENAYRISMAVAGFGEKDLTDRDPRQGRSWSKRKRLRLKARRTFSIAVLRRVRSSAASSSRRLRRRKGSDFGERPAARRFGASGSGSFEAPADPDHEPVRSRRFRPIRFEAISKEQNRRITADPVADDAPGDEPGRFRMHASLTQVR